MTNVPLLIHQKFTKHYTYARHTGYRDFRGKIRFPPSWSCLEKHKEKENYNPTKAVSPFLSLSIPWWAISPAIFSSLRVSFSIPAHRIWAAYFHLALGWSTPHRGATKAVRKDDPEPGSRGNQYERLWPTGKLQDSTISMCLYLQMLWNMGHMKVMDSLETNCSTNLLEQTRFTLTLSLLSNQIHLPAHRKLHTFRNRKPECVSTPRDPGEASLQCSE